MHSGVTDFLLMQAKGLDKVMAVNTDWFYIKLSASIMPPPPKIWNLNHVT